MGVQAKTQPTLSSQGKNARLTRIIRTPRDCPLQRTNKALLGEARWHHGNHCRPCGNTDQFREPRGFL